MKFSDNELKEVLDALVTHEIYMGQNKLNSHLINNIKEYLENKGHCLGDE